MKLDVLGSSAAVPASGDACTGYLVSQDSTRLVLDCGSGTLSRLLDLTHLEDVSAIFISHFHPDHYLDLITMRYAIRYGPPGHPRLPLLVPPGAGWFITQLGLSLRNAADFFEACFDLREYASDRPMQVGDLELTFRRTTHDEPTWAVSAGAGATRLVYTADTRVSADLERFARDADVLLCEATYPTRHGQLPADNHLSGRQAGEMAHRAGARHLVLTHFWPAFSRGEIAEEAAQAFDGRIDCARAGMQIEMDSTPALAELAHA